MTFEAIIFDLDGTLVDTLEDLADALNRTLGAEGVGASDYEHVRAMIGNGIRRLVTDALPPARRSEQTIERCCERFMADYGAHCLDKTRPYEGITALLCALRDDAVKLAVLSNKADELTQRIVGSLIGLDGFEVVMGARPGVPLKPDPTGARLVGDALGVPRGAVVYLGDSAIDMQAAGGAGMVAVGVSWGFRARRELIAAGASIVLDHPRELLELRR